MLNKKTLQDAEVYNRIVLVRTDYNIPLENGKIVDDLRIRASLPTIHYLREHGAKKIIIISHLGRPDGQTVPELSLVPVAERLAELLPDCAVQFLREAPGPELESALKYPSGDIILLENLRFYPGEEQNDAKLAHEMVFSTGAELFVQDGFAVIHRAHASTAAITNELPSVAGLLLEKEITALSELTQAPKHPFTIVLGGAKVSDKQPLIDKLGAIADHIIVGGKIAADLVSSLDNSTQSNTGQQSSGSANQQPSGSANQQSNLAQQLSSQYADKIFIANDFVTDVDGAKLDIGPNSMTQIAEIIQKSETVLWNGTLGKVEDEPFAKSSTALAELLGSDSAKTTVICGGDTTGFVENLQKNRPDLQYTLVSTGGGAALELLSGEQLPGVESLLAR